MLPSWLKEYLSFHRTERNGIIFLAVVLLCLVGFNLYQNFFWQSDWEQMKLKHGDKIVRFIEETDSIREEAETHRPWIPTTRDLFQFDPNRLDSAGWVRLGFSPKQSAAILKYRNAGAVFRKPEDVKKLFVVDEQQYEELRPYIKIEEIQAGKWEKDATTFENKEKRSFKPVVLELNSADTAQLKQLYGIGSSFAKRIVKYRELLGGYISTEQLLEVYGMDSARYLPIKENIVIDTTVRRRMNINTADFKELLRHPYLDKNQVNAIINYRKQHGAYKQLSELENIHLVRGESYRKIAPYLTVP